MAKVQEILEMWQGSQNLCGSQGGSRTQKKQITAVGYITDMEEIVKASWSLFQHDVWLHLNCQKDFLCHGLTLQMTFLEAWLKYQMFAESEEWIVIQSKVMRIAHLQSILDAQDWLNWTGDMDIPNDT